jgi:hypothetical protein
MDGKELREAILREESGEGYPYKVEVYYDDNGDLFFRGGWPHFAEDDDLHQGFFLVFNYHCGMSKFDMKSSMGRSARRSMKLKFCKGILPLTIILINDDTRASDDLMCLASLICRF